jgi:hypothetical protein
MPVNQAAQLRYEALFRAMRRRSLLGLGLCFAATALLAATYAIWLARPLAGALLATGLPGWTVAGISAALVLTIGLTLPNLAQLIVIHGETARAIEAVNAWALAEDERFRSMGITLKPIRRAEQVLATLSEHAEIRGLLRVRLLAWAGAVEAARIELAGMPAETPVDRFEVALLTSVVSFVETGSADLGDARAALANVPAEDYDRSLLNLALETARLEHAAGRPWQTPLAAARRDIEIPRRATFLGRLLSLWRTYAAIVGAGTLFAIVLSLTD